MLHLQVKRLHGKDAESWGFIRPCDRAQDLFFHASALSPGLAMAELKPGDDVEFCVTRDPTPEQPKRIVATRCFADAEQPSCHIILDTTGLSKHMQVPSVLWDSSTYALIERKEDSVSLACLLPRQLHQVTSGFCPFRVARAAKGAAQFEVISKELHQGVIIDRMSASKGNITSGLLHYLNDGAPAKLTFGPKDLMVSYVCMTRKPQISKQHLLLAILDSGSRCSADINSSLLHYPDTDSLARATSLAHPAAQVKRSHPQTARLAKGCPFANASLHPMRAISAIEFSTWRWSTSPGKY